MRLTRLYCRGFRCLGEVDFEPGPGVNVIRGENAQGKTSLLEAVLFAATSKSHRTNLETELLQRGRENFQIRIEVTRSDRAVVIEVNWWNGQKRVKVNGVPQTRLSDLLGKVQIVFFAPEDIALVKGGAGTRRRFLDMELSQLSIPYLNALQHYRQVLRQRNELLRHDRPKPDLLDVWDAQLAEHGAVLMTERGSFVLELDELASTAYAGIAGGESLRLKYAPDTPPGRLSETLASKRETDLRRRQTVHGPHRDDIEITIAGSPARSHGSQGQQKSAALALKLAELELIHRRIGEYPVFLLDEVLAELDAQRARQLFDTLPESVQCVVTTTDLERAFETHTTSTRNYLIEGGSLTRLPVSADHG